MSTNNCDIMSHTDNEMITLSQYDDIESLL